MRAGRTAACATVHRSPPCAAVNSRSPASFLAEYSSGRVLAQDILGADAAAGGSLRLRAAGIRLRGRRHPFADAAYILPNEFLRELKAVDLTIHEQPSISAYVPESELHSSVVGILAENWGIAVQPNSPMQLDVNVAERRTPFDFDDGSEQEVHDIVIRLAFTTRGVVRRGNKLYPIVASPVVAPVISTVFQGTEERRALFGDEMREDLGKKLPRMIRDVLDTLSNNTIGSTAPWYAGNLTDSEKDAAHAEFVSLMRGPVTAAGHFAGINVMPVISSVASDVEGCEMPSPYLDRWRAAFTKLGWIEESAARSGSSTSYSATGMTSTTHRSTCAFGT